MRIEGKSQSNVEEADNGMGSNYCAIRDLLKHITCLHLNRSAAKFVEVWEEIYCSILLAKSYKEVLTSEVTNFKKKACFCHRNRILSLQEFKSDLFIKSQMAYFKLFQVSVRNIIS